MAANVKNESRILLYSSNCIMLSQVLDEIHKINPYVTHMTSNMNAFYRQLINIKTQYADAMRDLTPLIPLILDMIINYLTIHPRVSTGLLNIIKRLMLEPDYRLSWGVKSPIDPCGQDIAIIMLEYDSRMSFYIRLTLYKNFNESGLKRCKYIYKFILNSNFIMDNSESDNVNIRFDMGLSILSRDIFNFIRMKLTQMAEAENQK